MRQWKWYSILFLFFFTSSVFAKTITVKMYATSAVGKGRYLGMIIATDTSRGLLLVPRLHGLSQGYHGFHLHDKPSCADFGKAAGGHWDPKKTGKHRGPYRPHGHRGDLPKLYINSGGFSTRGVIAPRLTVSNLKGHALVIHAHGDNYSDKPKKLGGGGARVACGVIK